MPLKASINPSFQPKAIGSSFARSATGALKWEIENEPVNVVARHLVEKPSLPQKLDIKQPVSMKKSTRRASNVISLSHSGSYQSSVQSSQSKTPSVPHRSSNQIAKPATRQLNNPASNQSLHQSITRSVRPDQVDTANPSALSVQPDDSDRASQFEQLVAQFAQQKEDRPRHVGLFVPSIIANKHKRWSCSFD